MMKFLKIISILIAALLIAPLQCFAAAKRHSEKSTFTVVIDAGHGGKDTGAVDNGVKEKDINLGVAQALAQKIRKKMKNVKVVMTRDNDTFISLQQRADKANSAKADLFISIHTNSVDASNKNRRSVAGASVYALGLHKDANNMAVARRENAVIELEKGFGQKYKGFDPNSDESYIIFEMAQKKNLSQSIRFANEVQKQLVAEAGRRDRGVHQAGFWVLWATSMPAVLIELDFICNPNSAKFMASETGHNKLAEAIYKAVVKYRDNLVKTSSSKNRAEAEIYDNESGDETILLATCDNAPRKSAVSTPTASTKTAIPSKRRRRSNASRIESANRDLEAKSIVVNTHPRSSKTKADFVDIKSNTRIDNNDADKKSVVDPHPEKNKIAKNTKNKNNRHDSKSKSDKRIVNNKIVALGKTPADPQEKTAKAFLGSPTTAKNKKSQTALESREGSDSDSHINKGSLRARHKKR